ncbi:MAG: hypothetical protein ACTSQG_00110 [Promethearchaeota archaeon]
MKITKACETCKHIDICSVAKYFFYDGANELGKYRRSVTDFVVNNCNIGLDGIDRMLEPFIEKMAILDSNIRDFIGENCRYYEYGGDE